VASSKQNENYSLLIKKAKTLDKYLKNKNEKRIFSEQLLKKSFERVMITMRIKEGLLL